MTVRRRYFKPEELLTKAPTEWTAKEIAAAYMAVGNIDKKTFSREDYDNALAEILEHGCADLTPEDARKFTQAFTQFKNWLQSFKKTYLLAYTDARLMVNNLNRHEMMTAAQYVIQRSTPSYYPIENGKTLTPEQSKEMWCSMLFDYEKYMTPEPQEILRLEADFREHYKLLVAYNAIIDLLSAYYEVDIDNYKVKLSNLRERYQDFLATEYFVHILEDQDFKPMDFKACKVKKAEVTKLRKLLPRNTGRMWFFYSVDHAAVQALARSIND